MDIVIIEDEKLVSEDLSEILRDIDNGINITGVMRSVEEAVTYFKKGVSPDLIFSDIQLGDGYSFEIFHEVDNPAPVIYCTAFNQHALQAFETNGIAYVLKPYTRSTIKQALDKYRSLQRNFYHQYNFYQEAGGMLRVTEGKVKTLLVNHKNKIIPIRIAEVALFSIENKTTILITAADQKFSINHTLDELESICGENFFRANRQVLLNKTSVKEVIHYSFRKLFVNLNITTGIEVIINKEKSRLFLEWLKN